MQEKYGCSSVDTDEYHVDTDHDTVGFRDAIMDSPPYPYSPRCTPSPTPPSFSPITPSADSNVRVLNLVCTNVKMVSVLF